jgi:hypothetical protein
MVGETEVATLSDPQEQLKPIDLAICDSIVASVPETWNVVVLTLIGKPHRVIGSLEHSLSSPEGHPPFFPIDALYEATRRLDELLHEHGAAFVTATYTVELRLGSWSYQAEFGYDPGAG